MAINSLILKMLINITPMNILKLQLMCRPTSVRAVVGAELEDVLYLPPCFEPAASRGVLAAGLQSVYLLPCVDSAASSGVMKTRLESFLLISLVNLSLKGSWGSIVLCLECVRSAAHFTLTPCHLSHLNGCWSRQ